MMLSVEEMVGLLKAGGETTRLRLLSLLSLGDLSVKDLTSILNQSQPRISRHLKLLYEAGLVDRLPEGAWVYYRLLQEGDGGAVASRLLAMLDPEDALVQRDLERLSQVKQMNAKIASDYFQLNAERWEELRALHVPESAVEKAILACLEDHPINQMLDLGTGTGSILALLGGRCQSGLGLDSNRSMLSIARSRLDGPEYAHLHVQAGDILDLAGLEARYDLVTLHQVLHYLDDPSSALLEAYKVMVQKGFLLIVDFAPHEHEFLRRDHAHRRLGFSHQTMKRWLDRSGFRLLEVTDLKADPAAIPMGAQDLHAEADHTPLIVTIWLAEKMK